MICDLGVLGGESRIPTAKGAKKKLRQSLLLSRVYNQQWKDPNPGKPVDSVRIEISLSPEMPIVPGIIMGVRVF